MNVGKSDGGECSPDANGWSGDVAVRPMQADAAGVAATELNLSAPFKSLPKSLFDRAVDVRDLGKT